MSLPNPIRNTNAIDQVAFVIKFKKDLDDVTLLRLLGLKNELKSDFPVFDIINVMQMVLDDKAPRLPVSKQGGVALVKRSDEDEGRAAWSIRIEANNIVVACSEFTTWSEVWGKAESYLTSAVNKFDLEENPIIELVFQCIDKFIGSDDLNKIKVEDVFSTTSDYVTKNIVNLNPLAWHLHQGWFSDHTTKDIKALNNLNLSAHLSGELKDTHETIINHIVNIRKKDGTVIASSSDLFGTGAGEASYLSEAMLLGHHLNKEVLENLLSKSMANRIGLVE